MSSIAPQEEAAAIFVRLFESLDRASGKTLKSTTRNDIARACELLTQRAGGYDLLDDLLQHTPPRRDYSTVSFNRDQADAAEGDRQYVAWRERQRREG
jgi:hypothetical protein